MIEKLKILDEKEKAEVVKYLKDALEKL